MGSVRRAAGNSEQARFVAHSPGNRRWRFYQEHPAFRPIGDTDSEIVFCSLLECLRVVAELAKDFGQFGPANFLYCDGEVLFPNGHRRKQADGTYSPPGSFWLHRGSRPGGWRGIDSSVSLKTCGDLNE